jgi:hypothetical protein
MHFQCLEKVGILARDEGDEHADGALEAAPYENLLPAWDEAGFGDVSWDILV